MKFFEKIYAQRMEGSRFYYEGDLFFDMNDCSTNIPRKDQRHYRIPATNPECAGESLSVKTFIRLLANVDKFGVA